MDSEERRLVILRMLRENQGPLSGRTLSASLGVTRQVIVADIALLRAKGEDIIATPRGYIVLNNSPEKIRETIGSKHSSDPKDIADELNIIVDNGGTIVDVIVEHQVYGEITGSLRIASRHDVTQFLQRLKRSGAEPLLVLTEGVHLHTIEVDSPEQLDRIKKELAKSDYLLKDAEDRQN